MRLENKITKMCAGNDPSQTDRVTCKYISEYHQVKCNMITEKYNCIRETLYHGNQLVELRFKKFV